MRRFLTLTVLVLASHYAFSQTEICNNGLDDDFDGFIDCYDGSCANNPLCDGLFLGNDAACEAVPPAFPQFTMSLDFSSPNETTNHLSRLAIGDLDRDGIPEMVTMNRYTRKIFILNGNNGAIKHEATVTWEPYWEVAIANIDNDNCGEIYFIGYQDPPGNNNAGVYIFAYDCQLNKLWETAQRLPGDPINFGLADFDGDGLVELYAKDEIYDAKTGVRIVRTSASNYGRQNGGPVAANIVGDDKLELISGLKIFQVNLGARTLDAGSLTLLQSRPEYFIRNEYNATSVADYNLDGFLDVLASGSTNSNGDNTTVFFWDVQNNTIRTYNDFQPALGTNYEDGWINGTGRLNIADLDGNGRMNASYVSGRFLYALDENFNLLWRVNINEETSGHTGCTLFDFNGDGKAEIVYRDERFIYIIEGTDGSVYSQQACISRTNREYPIVADVDADGSTELCVPCGFNDANAAANFNNLGYSRYSHIRVFKSAAEPWVPARRVWNQHGYFVVNVNDDLTIPRKLQAHQLVFSTGNCTQGPNRPLNKFLNQSPYLNSEGCPTYAAPDIAFHVAPTIIPPTCPSLNFQVSFKITNLGDVAVTGNIPVSFYSSDPMQAGAAKLATINIPVNGLANGDIVSVDNQTITGNGSAFVYVVLNDAGTSLPTPIVLPNTNFIECDYDNIRFAQINPLPVAITGIPVSANETCSGTNNGVARAFIPNGVGGENTADYNFYWSNGGVAKPIASADFIGPVYSGIPAGTYTVYARHKTANCNSDTTQVVIGTTTAPFPPITINVLSDQTTCSPFNGRLEAVISGGGAGYSIDWYDIALNNLGISGPIASNLQAGSYLAVISRGPCNTSVPATVNPPTVPDASASVLQDVVDCSNPNSGSVTADALVSGVVQNPANYTFTWYEYDNTNSTRGSVLPAVHGTGKTRTGLPVGFYQVEVRENASQCPSTITPIVEIESDLNPPDAPQIVILSSQTSCDPLQPNGVMTANVTVGGVPQNPADFTFEWFKGQNTLPVNLQTTNVSDVNGKTVNQVAGGGIPYTVRVTNAFNCSATADLPITENIINPVVTLAQLTPNTVCDPAKATTPYNGSLQASVTFNGNPVTLPDNNYTFEWRNPANAIIAVADNRNPVLSGLQDGNSYSVTVRRTDLACASAPDTEPVLRATVLPQLSTTSTGSNTCDPAATPDGTATVSITNAVPADAFTFRWHSGNSAIPANVLAASNNFDQATAIRLGGVTGSPNPYTVLVTNTRTGCENTATQFVSDESVIPVISFLNVTPNTKCVAPFDGGLTAQITNQIGAITDYNFDWYNGNSNASPIIGGVDGAVLANRDVGFYTVEVENTVTGCRSTAITNQVPDGRVNPAVAFLPPVGSLNCDASLTPRGEIEANVTNGGTNFSYLWTSVGATPAVNASNNNTSKRLINVGGPTFGGPAHSYNVLVTNTDTGCQGSNVGAVPDLSVKPTMTLDVDPNTVCTTGAGAPANFNGSLEVVAVNHPNIGTSTITYEFFNAHPVTGVPGAAIGGPTTNNELINLDNGKYGVRVTIDALGCTSEIEVDEVVDLVDLPNIDAVATPNLNCPGGAITNNGSALVNSVDGNPAAAPYTFRWFNGPVVAGASISTSATLGTNLAENQTFTVEVRNTSNGCVGSETVTVTDGRVTPIANISIVSHNQNCTGTPNGELLATATNAGANFTFTWAPAVTVTGADNQNNTQLAAGSYDVFVRNDDTGCQSAIDTETILNNFVYPNVTLTVAPQSACVGQNGSVTANDPAPGTRTFSWYTGVGTGSPLATDPGETNIIDDLASNDYTVEVEIIATGCKTTQGTFVHTLIVPPTVSLVNTKAVEICGPLPSLATPDGAASVTLGAITTLPAPNFEVFYVRTEVINGVGAGTFPTDPAVIKASAESYVGGANPPSLIDLAPGYLTALVVDNNTGCESTPNTVSIADNTSNYTINISGVATAGQCAVANPGGAIDIDVLKNGVPCTTCTFEWYNATPINSDINFFNNPPDMNGAPIITTNEDLGNPDPVGGVESGDYTVIVLDSNNGCGAFEVENIPTTNPATIVVTPTQPTECVNASNPTNNGAIQVSVTEPVGHIDGYTVNIFAGNGPSGTLLISNPGNTFITNQANLNSGSYFVQVVDGFAANTPCPQGFPVTLLSRAFNPSVTIDQINPNTSCDPANFSDGSIELTVFKDPADLSADQNYEIVQVTPQPRVAIGVPLLIGASGNSGESVILNTFRPQTVQPSYVIRVQDNISSCFRDVTVIVPDAKDMPSVLAVTPTPETNCSNAALNNSNGSALAQLADPLDTENLFDFVWAKNSDLSGPVFTAAGNNALTGGELLNQSKTGGIADWAMGPDGEGSGDRTYFVRATKNTGAGRACQTGIMQVVIPDAHITPNLALTPLADSFCNATAANGVIGDGQIQVVADANPSTGAQDIPAGGFIYNWTPVPGGSAIVPPNPSVAATYSINQLGDGSYTVTVRNTTNQCIVTNSVTVNPAPLVINLATTNIIDQRICNNDGEIEITGINIVNQSTNTVVQNSAGAAIDPLYTFRWYSTPAMTATTELEDAGATDITGRTLSIDLDNDFITELGDYPNMQAGTYYVVATRSAGAAFAAACPTLPLTVVVNDVHSNPVIDLAPLSNTSCVVGTGDGEIRINIADATSPLFGPFTFDYAWTGGLGLSNGNNGNGVNDGDNDRELNLLEGTYTLTVDNPRSGCSSVATVEVLKNSSPIFIQAVVPVDEIRCDPANGDGSLTVTSVTLNDRSNTSQSLPVTDFTFDWSRQGNGFTQAGAGAVLNDVTYNQGGFGNNIGAGTYFVTARRVGPAGSLGINCVSAPFTAIIQDKRINPVVSLTPFANTACDPAFSEGSIEVRVADNTLVPGPHTFSYDWDVTAPADPTVIPTSLTNNGDGVGTGDGDVPQNLFHGDYDVRVVNNQSGCFTLATTTLFRNSTPIIIPEAIPTPQVLCSADGTIRVTSVEVTDRNNNTFAAPFADFDFTWTPVAGGPPVVTDGALGAVPGGTIIDRTVYPTIQRGQYFVTATRVGGTLGRGCVSAPYHATIEDLRVFPELTFTMEANSSCTNLAPNGVVVANAREISGVNTGPYTFGWVLNGGPVSPASVQTDNANSSTLSAALDGSYLVTATNTITSCPVTSPVTLVLDQSLSTPNIIEVTTVDPLDCNPTGQASVTRITLGSTTNSILFPPNVPPNNEISGAGLAAFDYEWYQGSITPGNQLPIGGPVFTTTPTITSLLTGTYFVVVRDPATDCRSGARQVVINPDDIILPDLNVSQTALQISCRPGIGSAELSVTADGQTNTNPNYTFTWFANDSSTPPSIGTSSTLSNITAGTYSVLVHDNTTNCSISDSYIVEDDTQEFTPVISMASQPRTLCVGTDGELSARVLNLSPLYPYPYNASTFTADLYFGANPNLNNAPDMPAIPNTVGFIGNFSQGSLNEGFYTVRVTDNNTGCFTVATEEVKDARQFPVVVVLEIAPVTNCDPARPNGVAQVTANNTFVGFSFAWYEGTTATGTPVYSGAEFGELKVKPQQYTVRATHNISGCFSDVVTDIEDGTVPIPAATIEVLSHVTSCVTDNGSLAAYVGADKNTANYIFHWYDGNVENPPADFIGEIYDDRPVGEYSVTATSIITGCKSPLATEEILNEQLFPNFDFVIQNSTCDQQDGFASMILLTDVPIESIDWFQLEPVASNGPITEGPNLTAVGAGRYEVIATTFLGCSTTKQVEIKPDIRPYNGISRNNDGRNEIFQIDCIQNFPSNVVRVFNRAGTLVYEGESYDNTNTVFDGKSNRGISPMGVNLPDGTYYYIVDKRDGTKPIAGYLEIVQ